MKINDISDAINAIDEIGYELDDSRLVEIAEKLREISGKIEELI